MGIKIAKIGNKQITVKPLLKSFYCPKCTSIRTCTHEKNGFWFLLEVQTPLSKFWVIDGWGRTREDTFIDELFEPWEEVKSCPPLYYFKPSIPSVEIYMRIKDFAFKHWVKYFPLPLVIPYDDQLKTKINQLTSESCFQITVSDLVVIAKVLQNNLVRKYHIFDQFSLSEIELAPEFLHLYPLLKVYKRAKIINLPSAVIEEKPNSFTSVFKLTNSSLSIRIPKKRYTFPLFKNNYFYFTSIDQKNIIAYSPSSICYAENVNYISLILVNDTSSSSPLRIPARIVNNNQLHVVFDILFNYRLKKFLFIPLQYQSFLSTSDKIIFSYYPPSCCDNLTLQNATLANDNSLIHPTSSAPIIVQDKDQYIVLPPAQYEFHSI